MLEVKQYYINPHALSTDVKVFGTDWIWTMILIG